MEYLALYRKWRPRGFADFVGQPHVVRTLKNAVAQNRVAHAYLFCGPRGTGKTTAAKILARAVNCAAPNEGDPCGDCPSCRRIADGVSLDVQEIDGASNRGIDEVRDLREKVRFAPAEGRFRVYIIDEVHMLTGEAFNALLKTLEEPPPHVVFIFATTEPHRLPATVLSRCQRFEFKRFGQTEIEGRLIEIAKAEGIEAEPAALSLIASQAAGGMRDAIGLLEQAAAHADRAVTRAGVREVLGLPEPEAYRRLAEALRDRDPAAALGVLAEVTEAGKDLVQFGKGATGLWRDLLVLAVSRDRAPLQSIPEDEAESWRDLALAIGPERLLHAVETFAGLAAEQRRSGEARLPMDLALIKITAGVGLDAQPAAGECAASVEPRPAAAAPASNRSGIQQGKTRSAPAGGAGGEARAAAPAEPAAREWETVQSRLNKLKRSLASYVNTFATPAGIEGQAFILRFKSRDFAAKVQDNREDRELIERILAEVYGRPLNLNCQVGEVPQAPAAKSEPDPVKDTMRLFDGTLEEE